MVGVPLPGPVLGLLGLYIDLVRGQTVPEPLDRLADGLLPNMAFFFVPAGAGVVAHAELFREEFLPILAAVVGGTLTGIAATALAVERLAVWQDRRHAAEVAHVAAG